jgi:uncharacterized membrane protein
MNHTATAPPSSAVVHSPPPGLVRGIRYIVIAGLGFLALRFLFKDAIPYFLDFSSDQFRRFWDFRWWLVLHISGGMVALVSGPFQFSTGLRRKHMKLHRRLGKLYLSAIAVGSSAAIYMGFTSAPSALGAAWGFALLMLAAAWITTSGMALLMIKRRMIDLHKEWMIRSYVVTFAFVTFRWLDEMPAIQNLFGDETLVTLMWVCWTIPLAVTEVVLQLRRAKRRTRSRAAGAA